MFGALKKLFTKPAKEEQVAPTTAPASYHTPAAAPQRPAPAAPARPAAGASARPAAPAASPAPAGYAPLPSAGAGETIAIPLTAVAQKLPSSLSSLVLKTSGVTLQFPAQIALQQLSTGKVRISFGQLRASVPPGAFADNASQDEVMIELPLPVILAAMNPAMLARRPQRKVDVPEDVTSIFGPKFKMKSGAAAAPPPPPAPAPVAPPSPRPPVVPTPAPLPPVAPLPTAPAAGPARPAAPVRPPVTPQRPPTPGPAPAPLPFAQKPGAPSPGKLPSMGAKPAAPAPPPPGVAPAPKAPVTPIAPKPAPAPPAPVSAAPSAPAPVAARPATPGMVQVPLSEIMGEWPDPVRQEIAHGEWDLSLVVIPVSELEAGMKTGQVVLTWGQLRRWLQPPSGSVPSPNDETPVELPLKVIAPLFIGARAPTAQRKVNLAGDIPDVFTGLKKDAGQARPAAPAPTPAAAPIPATAPTPAAPVPAPAPAPAVSHAPRPDGLGIIFGQPLKSEWHPPEIVQKICGFTGVVGCVIMTADGLLIAGQVPATQKAEMLASFLPQIFGRTAQYSAELQMGGLNAMLLFTGDTPCAIFKAGKLYLGVTGRAGESLPEALLLRVAAELAKRNP